VGPVPRIQPGASDEERLALCVIRFAATPPDASPGQAEVVRRLEAELQTRLRDDTLRLREPRQPFTGWTRDPDHDANARPGPDVQAVSE
jgi:hypothetical protein